VISNSYKMVGLLILDYYNLTDMTDILEKASKWGVAVVLLGYINIYSYYFWFGFSIYPYLETSEIIFSFSSMIIPIALILGVRLVMMYQENQLKEYEAERTKELLEKMNASPTSDKPKWTLLNFFASIVAVPISWIKWEWLRKAILFVVAVIYAYVSIFLLVVAVVLIFGLFSIIRLNDFSWEILFYAFFIVVLMTIDVFTMRSESKTKVYTIYAGAILFFILVRSHSSYNSVMDKNPKYKAALVLSDGAVKTTNDSTIFYIGSTRQYYFYHNIQTSENIVIPASTVKEARITELRLGL
jgi:hypothetical protein